MNSRWSDEKLDEFHLEFLSFSGKFDTHLKVEEEELEQQKALYAAVFQKEDKETNTPPGLLQMTMRVSNQLHVMQIWQDRQKTFIGGVLFTISSMWFFLTDAGPTLLSWFKKL